MSRPESVIAEAYDLPNTPLRVDEEKCVVYGVRVTGAKSKNRRKYPEAYQRSLLARLDGAECYWGHHRHPETGAPLQDIPPDKKLGRHTNPRMENGGVHTDVRYNPECPHAKQFVWAAKNDPAQLSFSQLSRVLWQPEPDGDGDRVAAECLELFSVDVVGRGGATETIFESFTSEASVASKTDPKAVAGEIDSVGAAIAFLTDLIGALPKDMDKAMILNTVMAAVSAPAPEPPAGATPDQQMVAAESLRKLGRHYPVAGWAAAKLTNVLDQEKAARQRDWAANLIKAADVPEGLRSDQFVSDVAECFGNEEKAKARIADRKALAAGGYTAETRTTDAGAKKKTVAEIVDGMAIG